MKTIELMKQIVEGESYKYVIASRTTNECKVSDEKIKGSIIVDMTSASIVLQVYNALGEENRKKFAELPLMKMIDVSFQLVNKHKS